ncbi:MAG TPA: phosphoglucomutase/phosphomannomutase family protein [Blastocatellia bacterium]|nr:phosphoglucomutase/phosphomannomutase family protein [Blastocatellia bacterium]
MTIAFGTDGWRAVIADGYTVANVERVAQALATYIADVAPGVPVLVGYDRRFMSEVFAERAAGVLAGNGLPVELFDRSTPTPVVSYQIAEANIPFGVVITASHNPATHNGFKIKELPGRSANPATIREIEARIDRTPVATPAFTNVRRVTPGDGYDRAIARVVDLDAVRSADVTIVADAIHGAAGDAVARLLAGGSMPSVRVVTIRSERDPYFGGVNPEPIPQNIGALSDAVRSEGALLGIANDGDADRLGAVDENGRFLTSQMVLAILILHLAERRGERGSVIKTVSQSRVIDRMAAEFGLEVRETPIGFKYIADEICRGGVLIGGEESGGFGFRGFVPERDGVLSGLMLAEAVLASSETPSQLVAHIQKRFGPLFYDRRDLRVAPATGLPLVASFAANPPTMLASSRVVDVVTLDGTKFVLDDESWLLLRQSGTEPVLRVYSEATSEAKRDALLEAGVAMASERR